MTNAEQIARIKGWQDGTLWVHPLTCGNDSQGRHPLSVIEDNGQVLMRCIDCGYRQTYIPRVVLEVDHAKRTEAITEWRGKGLDQ